MTQPPCLPELPKPLIARGDFPAFQAKIAMNCYSAVQMDHRWREGYEAGSAAAAQAVPEAMKIVCDAMRADPEYAWSWHCNIAMAFVDEGGNHAVGNHAAARFLRSLADVEPAHELPPRFELSDERIMQYLGPWHIQGDTDDRADLIQCVRAMLAADPTQGAEGAAPQAVVGEAKPVPLTEPVTVAKAMLAHRQAEVWLNEGTGPVCCVGMVNIQVTPWHRHNPSEAKAFADGFNLAAKWMRNAVASPTPTAPQEAGALPPFSELARLTQWLDAKFAQHGDQEDADASKLLHKLWRAALAPQEADALREALKECLDSLEYIDRSHPEVSGGMTRFKSIKAARAALAQHQPQQGEQG